MGSGQKIKFFLLRKIAKIFINSIIFTCKREIEGKDTVKDLKSSNIPIIYIFWHRHIFFNIFQFKKTNARPLVSFSPDGELVARIAEEFGMNPVRGSSSRGGARAFLQMVTAIKTEKSEIMITADGPRGPVREIKDGTILIAKKTGAALVPISWYASRVKIFEKSWDKFMIPLPFSKIHFSFGKPEFIPNNISQKNYFKYKNLLKLKLDGLEEKIKSDLGI